MAHNEDDDFTHSREHEYHRDGSPKWMEASLSSPGHSTSTGISSKAVDEVLYSEIGINVLLIRLKQSVASARDFAGFLKKRSVLEEEHAQGLRKISTANHESVRRQETRQGSYALQLADITRVHERMAEHGMQFSLSLRQMHDDLNELCLNMERGRKHWKTEGTNSEKKVKDAESLMDKAKTRYDSLAEDYDRVRTGDKSSGRVFTIKGPKSATQHEEDLHKKVMNADADYAEKVDIAQAQRQENLASSRPAALKAIQELIFECDSALTLQLQKYAAFSEKLLLSNGHIVSPLKSQNGETAGTLSMREMIQQIDNGRDFQLFVTSHTSQLPMRPVDIKYEKHPTLATPIPVSPLAQRQPQLQQIQQTQQIPQSPSAFDEQQLHSQQQPPQPNFAQETREPLGPYQQQSQRNLDRDFGSQGTRQYPANSTNGQYASSTPSPQVSRPSQTWASPTTNGTSNPSHDRTPINPVFGVSLEALFRRDESAVPMVVHQCIQAVDLFGLRVEGIYRLSGNVNHINQLKAVFDNDPTYVDFRNPENFHHDVNSVAGLLKQFFRDLPDPLLTLEHYDDMIAAARIEDEMARRDSLHAIINSLPDPNYATLRALVLSSTDGSNERQHLNRVQEHSQVNRMSIGNLAICFAPTIMGPHVGPHMVDAGLQARVVDTILQNTYQIFDED